MIGCIRAAGHVAKLKAISGLMLLSNNAYALVRRDDQGKIASIRYGSAGVLDWWNRGERKPYDPTLNDIPVFRGDLRIREDGRMAAGTVDVRVGQPENGDEALFSRDYGATTSAIARELEVEVYPLPRTEGDDQKWIAHVADKVTAVDYQTFDFATNKTTSLVTFMRHDRDPQHGQLDFPYTPAFRVWPGRAYSGGFNPDQVQGANAIGVLYWNSGTAYRLAIASRAGAWGLGSAGALGAFCGGDGAPTAFDHDWGGDLPGTPAGLAFDWAGLVDAQPICVVDAETVRLEARVDRWSYGWKVGGLPNQPGPGPDASGPRNPRVYLQEIFIFDVIVRRGAVEAATLTASCRVTPTFAANGSLSGQTWKETGTVWTAGMQLGDQFRTSSVDVSKGRPADYLTVMIPIDAAEKVALVQRWSTGRWQTYSDASGYADAPSQTPFSEYVAYGGQTAVLKELKVDAQFHSDFLADG